MIRSKRTRYKTIQKQDFLSKLLGSADEKAKYFSNSLEESYQRNLESHNNIQQILKISQDSSEYKLLNEIKDSQEKGIYMHQKISIDQKFEKFQTQNYAITPNQKKFIHQEIIVEESQDNNTFTGTADDFYNSQGFKKMRQSRDQFQNKQFILNRNEYNKDNGQVISFENFNALNNSKNKDKKRAQSFITKQSSADQSPLLENQKKLSFCSTCQIVIINSNIVQHQYHEILDLNVALEKKIISLQNEYQNFNLLQKDYQQQIKVKQNIQEKKTEYTNKINHMFQDLKDILHLKQKQTIQSLDDQFEQDNLQISRQIGILKLSLDHQQEIEQVIQSNDQDKILNFKLQNFQQDLNLLDKEQLSFNYYTQYIDKNLSKMQDLKFQFQKIFISLKESQQSNINQSQNYKFSKNSEQLSEKIKNVQSNKLDFAKQKMLIKPNQFLSPNQQNQNDNFFRKQNEPEVYKKEQFQQDQIIEQDFNDKNKQFTNKFWSIFSKNNFKPEQQRSQTIHNEQSNFNKIFQNKITLENQQKDTQKHIKLIDETRPRNYSSLERKINTQKVFSQFQDQNTNFFSDFDNLKINTFRDRQRNNRGLSQMDFKLKNQETSQSSQNKNDIRSQQPFNQRNNTVFILTQQFQTLNFQNNFQSNFPNNNQPTLLNKINSLNVMQQWDFKKQNKQKLIF